MPFINRVPKALLSVLDGQTMGTNPKDMESLVRGTLELRPFYFAGKGWEQYQVQSVYTTGTKGFQGAITIPDGEVWIIRNMGIQVQGAVGMVAGNAQWTPVWTSNSGGVNYVPLAPIQQIGAGELLTNKHGVYFDDNFVAVAGDLLGWWLASVFLADVTIQSYANFVRFKA
jgi:hypothetical protein